MKLDKLQKKAIKTSTKHEISIINGHAGTGKSLITSKIATNLIESGWKVSKTAPTGRAAKRINGQTIHSWLDPEIEVNDKTGKIKILYYKKITFNLNECLIVDESSMVDDEIFNKIMEIWNDSIFDEKKIIFVGDVAQLEPVGEGKPFVDMILNKSYPITTLKTNYRTKNDILDFASSIRTGEKNIIQYQGYKSIKEVKLDRKIIEELLTNYKENQIISPYNKFRNGTIKINKKIQKFLLENNRLGKEAFWSLKFLQDKDGKWKIENDHLLHINDKVLFTKNIYTSPIRNGTIAILEKYENKSAYFRDIDNNRIFSINIKFILLHITLGYSISVHKAQGSEFKKICYILAPDQLDKRVRDNKKQNYTAITRAIDKVYIVR